MATKSPIQPSTAVREGRNPTVADLRLRARDAAREGRSIEYGSLSRADRARLLSERFGL